MGMWELPEGWEMLPLGEACEINPTRPRLSRDDDIPTSFVPMAAVHEGRGVIADPQTKPYRKVKRGYTYFEEGDVLFAKITPCMQNGKSAIARELIDAFGFGSTEFHVLRPSSRVIPEWAHLFVRRRSFRDEAMRHFRGAVGQQRVPAEFLESYPFPLPPLDEQRRIVARIEELFARIEEARHLRAAAIRDARELMTAALNTSFRQAQKQAIKIAPLGSVCEVEMGQSPPGDSYHSEPKGLPLLNGPTEFGAEHPIPVQWTTAPTKVCQSGDLLICVRGATTGRTNWADQSYCIGRGIAAIRSRDSEETLLDYIAHYVRAQADEILAAGRGSTFPNLTKTQLISWDLPLLTLEEQRRIVEYLDGVQAQVAELKRLQAESAAELAWLSGAVLARAFRGEL